MINIFIYQAATGKTEVPEKAQAEYIKRLSRIARIRIKKQGSPPKNSIWFHPGGNSFGSPELAALFEERLQGGNELHLVLGAPPQGSAADSVQLLSLPLTQRMESILLLEQIYRAFKIMAGEPYHK